MRLTTHATSGSPGYIDTALEAGAGTTSVMAYRDEYSNVTGGFDRSTPLRSPGYRVASLAGEVEPGIA